MSWRRHEERADDHHPVEQLTAGSTPIGDVTWRSNVKIVGRVRSMRVQPWAETVASLEITLVDDTGGLTVVFLGRRHIGGVELGRHMVVEGRVVESHNRLAIINPAYTLLPARAR